MFLKSALSCEISYQVCDSAFEKIAAQFLYEDSIEFWSRRGSVLIYVNSFPLELYPDPGFCQIEFCGKRNNSAIFREKWVN